MTRDHIHAILLGLAALASCRTPPRDVPRLAEGSATVRIDGPDRIEGRRAYVTQTLTNIGTEPLCFMYDANLSCHIPCDCRRAS